MSDRQARLADIARLIERVDQLAGLTEEIDRADAEASRLRERRLAAWVEARDRGMSWREIARASGLSDHVGVQRAVTKKGKDCDA